MSRILILGLAFPAFALACGGEEPAPAYDDIARGVAALVAEPNGGETLSFRDAIIAAGGSLPADMQLDSAGKLSGKRGDVTYKFELSCKDASEAALADCSGAVSADLKLEWKGKIDEPRYFVELDRKADWKARDLDQEIAKVSGKGRYYAKTELRDTMLRAKYEFDYDADYKDILVRVSDREIIGGELHYDLHAKLRESFEDTKIKESHHVHAKITFLGNGEADIDLDAKYKYKLRLDTGVVIKESITVK